MAVTAMESMVRSFASGHPADAARVLEGLEAAQARRAFSNDFPGA
jgi:hypothetical protein